MNSLVAALDVGGTSMKAGLIDRSGRVQAEIRRATGVEHGPRAVVDGIVGLAQELVDTAGAAAAGVGLCVPGTVDSATGIARHAVNLGWTDVPFAALVSERTGLPAVLAHDVRTAVLAEARIGAGVGAGSMFFVAIGTGIAGGYARDGEVDDGAAGLAGEIGHLVVIPDGPPCQCGNRGCLEAVASASRISTRYGALTGRTGVSAQRIAELVVAGEPAAGQIWAEAIDALADALAAATVLIDPGTFVIGGGLSLAGPTLIDPLAKALAGRLTFRSAPPLRPSTLGDRAGMLGAALRAWDLVDSAAVVS
ncbi:ROK family protein [Nakamurella panacisegetis]|uniref:ROK family protein n=1 Tax=Nakamurella panacisegetis TaxID=1090615 RepID=UPI0018D4C63C|nr:ROK family protein [Nakamurella panacisegetis]